MSQISGKELRELIVATNDLFFSITGTKILQNGDLKFALDVAVKEGTITTTPGGGGVSSGLTTEVTTVNGTTWVPVPAVALTGRAGFSIQNQSGGQIKVNFASGGGYVGVIIENNGERFYDINDSGVLFARSAAAGPVSGIIIEELKP